VAKPSQKNVTTKALKKTVPNDTRNLRRERNQQNKMAVGMVRTIGIKKMMTFSIKRVEWPNDPSSATDAGRNQERENDNEKA